MKPPCEVVSKYLLPAFRAVIARKLIEKYGFNQVDAASKLGLTQSAMSRYIGLERGGKIANIKGIQNLAEDVAKNIAESQLSREEVILKLCDMCIKFRRRGALCELHRHISTISEECRICYDL